MSKIDEMIKELCPDGVEYVKLGEIMTIVRGASPRPIKNYMSTPQQGIHWIKIGDVSPYDKYITNTNEYISKEGAQKSRLLKAGDFILSNSMSFGRPYILKISGCIHDGWIAMSDFEGSVVPDFLYEVLRSNSIQNYWKMSANNGGAMTNLNADIVRSTLIPIPPLSIQQKIVSVLDSFTTLIDKMKQEVEKRKKQMEYYCDLYYGGDIEGMMALANDSNNSVITFAELGTITRGKRFVRDDVRESGQPCIHYGDMYTYYGTKSFKANTYLDRDFPKKMRYANKGDVVIVGAGENDYDIGVGVVWMGDEPAAVHDACYILEHSQNPMYISYYLRSNIYHQQLKKHVSSGKISSFSAEGLGKVYIPIQPIEKQNEIVSTLDKFESYITKLEKMIVLRQKQYEYYREQLLTFE